eukprot:scaffold24952_cov66-Phaeocystis_antarctica.AAC.5
MARSRPSDLRRVTNALFPMRTRRRTRRRSVRSPRGLAARRGGGQSARGLVRVGGVGLRARRALRAAPAVTLRAAALLLPEQLLLLAQRLLLQPLRCLLERRDGELAISVEGLALRHAQRGRLAIAPRLRTAV